MDINKSLHCCCCGDEIDVSACHLQFDSDRPIIDSEGEIVAYNTVDGTVCLKCKEKLTKANCVNRR